MIDLAALPLLPPDFAWQRLYRDASDGIAVAVLEGYEVARLDELATGDGYACHVGRHRPYQEWTFRRFRRLDRAGAWIDAWIRMREPTIREEAAAKKAAFEARHFANWGGGKNAGATARPPLPEPTPITWTANDEYARRHGHKRRSAPKLTP